MKRVCVREFYILSFTLLLVSFCLDHRLGRSFRIAIFTCYYVIVVLSNLRVFFFLSSVFFVHYYYHFLFGCCCRLFPFVAFYVDNKYTHRIYVYAVNSSLHVLSFAFSHTLFCWFFTSLFSAISQCVYIRCVFVFIFYCYTFVIHARLKIYFGWYSSCICGKIKKNMCVLCMPVCICTFVWFFIQCCVWL